MPTQADRTRFKNKITEMLRGAVHVELSTIPLYLYSIYSIKGVRTDSLLPPGAIDGPRAKTKISVIVRQEMLHLALAGNILTAIDSGPRLYIKSDIPTYGPEETILYSRIPMMLEPCKKDNLECFLRIEAPYLAPPKLSEDEESANLGAAPALHALYSRELIPEYNSIGDFYSELEQMILYSGDYIDFKNKDLQYTPQEFFGDLMTQVVNDTTAHDAIKTIIDQGEGSVGVAEAHYQMFLELWERQTDWECYPVPSSPHSDDYTGTPFVYQLALASNATYCYLLITIEKTFQVSDSVKRRRLITNTHSIMIDIMNILADIMVQQPYEPQTPTNPTPHAGPSFEWYPTSQGDDPADIDIAANELHAAITEHLNNAINAANTPIQTQFVDALKAIIFSVGRTRWPST
ncbi:ferritin-like-domain-containing protein [Scleroderma yunnanense]